MRREPEKSLETLAAPLVFIFFKEKKLVKNLKFLALAAALILSLALFGPTAASETTSGSQGEGYVLASGGTMCYEPVPLGGGAYSPEEWRWLTYGEPVTLLHQPDMYFGWLFIGVDGSSCLVEQGTIQSGPSPLYSGEVDGSDLPDQPNAPEEPDTNVPEIPIEESWQPTEEPPQYEGLAVAEVTPVAVQAPVHAYSAGDPIVGLPSTGSGTAATAERIASENASYLIASLGGIVLMYAADRRYAR